MRGGRPGAGRAPLGRGGGGGAIERGDRHQALLPWLWIAVNGAVGALLLAGAALLAADGERDGWLLLLAAATSTPGIAGGVGLARGRRWARRLVVALSVAMLLAFPLGTALGGYTLWVLLARSGRPRGDGSDPDVTEAHGRDGAS